MALYALGDLHLHFQSDLRAPGQMTGKIWKNHEEYFLRNCASALTDRDTLVLVGDHSWGKTLAECEKDFAYIESLPGRKILTRGNHDMFWDAKKTAALNSRFAGRLEFLQGNVLSYRDYALVATKGYTFEGPFYLNHNRKIIGWDEENERHAEKLVERECSRLKAALDEAKSSGYRKLLIFLHYPPTNILEKDSPFTHLAEAYGAEQVIYAHSHGEDRFHDSIRGMYNGVYYRLVSGDFLRWQPMKLLD